MSNQEMKSGRKPRDTTGLISDRNKKLFLADVETRALSNGMIALASGSEGLEEATAWLSWASETFQRMGATILPRTSF